MMKTFKFLIAIALLYVIASAMAQAPGTDGYSYQANPGCEFKITLRTGLTAHPVTYELTYNGATPTQGSLDPNDSVKMQLPASSQWYDLVIGRHEVDKNLYTLETGCDTSGAPTVSAPAPVLTEDKWTAAQETLKKFIQQMQAN